ncbi:MAG: VCBS repeat-containing protein [bacterium]
MKRLLLLAAFAVPLATVRRVAEDVLPRLAYNNPGLLADLGVGLWAWPLPMDYNGDGLMDLVVVCTGKPSNGTWYFENSGQIDVQSKLPIFRPAVLIGPSAPSVGISYVDGKPIVTATASARHGDIYDYRANVFPDFLSSQFSKPSQVGVPEKVLTEPGSIRQNQWKFVDYDGDGALDVTLGIDFWGDFGPLSGGEGAFNEKGEWTRGTLHGYVYLMHNSGSTEKPVYASAVRLQAGGKDIDPYGMPSPSWGDFDGDGDLDLICGEFRDGFTYYANTGTRTKPVYAAGRALTTGGVPLRMDLTMITPTSVDFDGDGDLDLVVGDEDGRVAFIENTGEVLNGMPQFLPPRYFRQLAADVKFGALATPYAFDWDGDGDEDLMSGNSAGYVGFIENLGGTPIRWASPRYLAAGGKIIREQAGPNGSVQGPPEAKWGYSILSVGDWDGDGLPDIITNGIWGKIVWYKNVGTRNAPKLAAGQPVEVAPGTRSPKPAWNWWNPQGRELVTQWRTTPQMVDWNGDGLMDLVMSDTEGYLALYERKRGADGGLTLSAPQRVFWSEGTSVFNGNGIPSNKESGLLRLNGGVFGGSGRRTFCIVDWDGDGKLDILMNSAPNVNVFRALGRDAQGRWTFRDEGPVSRHVLAGHATKPTVTDWDKDGVPDLLIGAEDGFFYQVRNPRALTLDRQ